VVDVPPAAADRDRLQDPPPVVEPRQPPGHRDLTLRTDPVSPLLGVHAEQAREFVSSLAAPAGPALR